MKKIKYRIMSTRPDDPPQICGEPVFEAETVEACDEQAKECLEELRGRSRDAWENFFLVRIDVEEKTTLIGIESAHERASRRDAQELLQIPGCHV